MSASTEFAAFNIRPDGSVVMEGDHSPGTSGQPWGVLGIEVSRTSVGEYLIAGSGIAWPPGWRITIFRDDNDQNTSWVKLGTTAAGLTVSVRDVDDRTTPVDLVYLMTIRVSVVVDVTAPPHPTDEDETVFVPNEEPIQS